MKRLLTYLIVLIVAASCKQVEVLVVEESTKKFGDFECGLYLSQKEKNVDLELFKKKYKRKIIRQAKGMGCKCDTVYIDINNIWRQRGPDRLKDNYYYGACSNQKKLK